MSDIETLRKKLILSDDDIKKLTEGERDSMDLNGAADLIQNIISNTEEQEPGELESAELIVQMTHIAREAYIRGYMMALFIFNECIKDVFAEMEGAEH